MTCPTEDLIALICLTSGLDTKRAKRCWKTKEALEIPTKSRKWNSLEGQILAVFNHIIILLLLLLLLLLLNPTWAREEYQLNFCLYTKRKMTFWKVKGSLERTNECKRWNWMKGLILAAFDSMINLLFK